MEAVRLPDFRLGRVTISNRAISQIVGYTAVECYGVVGLDGGRVGRLFGREDPTRGVEVEQGSEGVAIALHVVVEYGLNLAEVASTIRSRVSYEVGRLTGLEVASVEVHIGDLRRGA